MNSLLDHRLIGARYDLFSFFDNYSPGSPVWHERGLRIKNALISRWRSLHSERGYAEIESPLMLDRRLWEISGHCDYFEENMYFSKVDKRDYAIKPMNCPGAILYFQKKRRDIRELPLRICELGHVHRHEPSGSLHGLMRVRSFIQDDAHIFCAKDQLLSEVEGVIDLIVLLMNACGLDDYHFELSLRGGQKQYLGEEVDWLFAEEILRKGLQKRGFPLLEREGEAKFYGPSLDLHIKDVHGRYWQCSSVQLDFNLPQRFNLSYSHQGERKVPFMLHRAIFGSLERFIAILLENFGMDLPLWLHPIPFKILSVDDQVKDYAREVAGKISEHSLHCELDLSDLALAQKIKNAFSEGVHEILIIGQNEKNSRSVALKKSKKVLKLEEFLNHL